MARRNQAWKLLVGVGVAGLAMAGCGWAGSGPTDSDGPGADPWAFLQGGTDGADGVTDDDAEPIEASDVAVLAGRPGDLGAAPKRVDLFLSKAVFSEDAVGATLDEATVVVVEPPVDVDITVASRDRLKVTPRNGFAPNTEYTVRIDSLATASGPLEPPRAGAWQTTFTTPALKMLRAVPVKVDVARRTVELDLVFSGPVDLSSLGGKVRITDSSGGRVAVSSVRGSSEANRARVKVTGSALSRKNTFNVAVDDGYQLESSIRSGVKGKGGTHAWVFDPSRPQLEIEAVHTVEGTSSFSVEVICDDDASEGYKRWTWLRHVGDSFRVSPRCLPTEESAREMISVSPEVPFTVVPTRGGFRLVGDFPQGTLQVEIEAGLASVDGGLLIESTSKELTIPALAPSVAFTTSGRYLPRDAWSRLPVQHRNVDELEVTIRHVPQENLLFWLTAEDEAATERVANQVAQKTFTVKSPEDERLTTWVDVKSMLPEAEQGVYEVTVTGGGASTSARLLMTDLNLVAKAGGLGEEDRLHVWALGMHDGANQAGVEITAVRPSGKPLATCTTTGTGCTFTLPEGDEAQPVALVARRGSDLTYLKFSDLETDVSESKVQGEDYDAEQSYRASLWTERGVFRPGETAHVAGVVRDEAHVAPPKNMPIDVQITDPRGKLIRTVATKANDAGVFSIDLPFPDYARTGSYTVTARAGSTRLGSVQFAVEEFVPERMEVKADVPGDGFLATDTINVSANARYLFGGSAKDHRYEVACRLVPTTFKPPKNGGYNFGESGKGRTLELGRV
ncbi:MAG: MG2 domain-containing protein, partial [Myxococcota bacterium]